MGLLNEKRLSSACLLCFCRSFESGGAFAEIERSMESVVESSIADMAVFTSAPRRRRGECGTPVISEVNAAVFFPLHYFMITYNEICLQDLPNGSLLINISSAAACIASLIS